MQLFALLFFLMIGLPAFAGQAKTDVCHNHGNGTFDLITVADPAVDAHVEHGDGFIGEDVPGQPGLVFDEICDQVDAPVVDPFLRARAWIDANENGRYDEGVDGLIAQLRDENGVPEITTGFTVEFPSDYNSPISWIPFTKTVHIGGSITALADGYRVTNGSDIFIFQANATIERYFERFATQDGSLSPISYLYDYMAVGAQDSSRIGEDSPSLPDTDGDDTGVQVGNGDDPFIQVSIFPAM